AVLEEYAPKMMSEDEIKAVISDVISGLGIEKPLPKDKGRIMKELMPKVKGKADGKLVNELVAGFMQYKRFSIFLIQIPELLLKIFFSMLPGFLFTGLCLNREILTAGREPFPVPQLSSGIHLCYNVPRR